MAWWHCSIGHQGRRTRDDAFARVEIGDLSLFGHARGHTHMWCRCDSFTLMIL